MKMKKINNKVFKKKNNKKNKFHKNHRMINIKTILNHNNKWKQKIVKIQTKTMIFKMKIVIVNNRKNLIQISRKQISKEMMRMLKKRVLTMKMIKKIIFKKKRNQFNKKKNLNKNNCSKIKNNSRIYKKR